MQQLADALRPHVGRVAYTTYRHWHAGGDIDVPFEIHQAAKAAKDLDGYIIVAKSIGSVIAILGIHERLLRPTACLFLGFPLRVVEANYSQLASLLADMPPTVFIQNDQDPLGSAAAVQAYVASTSAAHSSVVTTPGDTHDYTDFESVTRLVQHYA